MRIQRLELQGFKSFPDRTVFQFGSGISGIVGPNGCGKSNVVDAVKWCIGEQSARTLRGQVMEDVVFNGSASRPPVGYAEVSITFLAGDSPFPGEWARYEEIRVTRRLARGGTSDYFMNTERVRLRDIHDLLLDTGASNPLYSLIEQGRIGEIVQANPNQRRSLIEEAAGISRYKARRAETQERLVHAEENLNRSAHIVEELAERLEAISRQVERAARYRRYRAMVRQGSILGSLSRFSGLIEDRRALVRKERESAAELERQSREVAHAESELVRHREAVEVEERVTGDLRDRISEMEASRRELESALLYQGRERRDLEERATRLAKEIAEAGERRLRAEGEKARAETVLRDDSTRLDERSQALDGASAQDLARKGRIRELRSELEKIREELDTHRTALLRAGTRREASARQLAEVLEAVARQGREVERAREESVQLLETRATTEAQQAEANHRLAAASAALLRAREAVSEVEESLRRAREAHRLAERELTARERERAMAEGKLDSIRQLQASHAGLSDASRKALERVSGVFSVSEELEVPEEQRASLAAALGERFGALGFSEDETLLSIAREVKDGQVLAVRVREEDALATDGLLLSVGGTERARKAVFKLLGPLFPAADLGDALARRSELSSGGSFVTPRGEILSALGVAQIGRPGLAGASILGRRKMLLEAEAELRRVMTGVEAARLTVQEALRFVDELQTRQRDLVQEAEKARNGHHDAELEATALGFRLKSCLEALARQQRLLQDLDAGEARELKRSQLLEGEVVAREEEAAEAREAQVRSEATLTEAQARIRVVELDDLESSKALSELREEVARLRERVHSGQTSVDLAARSSEEAREAEQRSRSEAERVAARQLRIEVQLQETETSISKVATEQTGAHDKLEIQKKTLKEARDRLKERELARDDVRHRRDESARSLEVLQGRISEILGTIETLKRESEEVQGISLPGMLDRLDKNGQLVVASGLPKDECLPATVRGLPPVEDLVIVPDHLEDSALLERWRKESEQARRKMDALGDVNLAAMEEYQEVHERYSTLEAERKDLEATVLEIRSAIARINRTCRERFREAFDKVNDNFRDLYARLAGGGGQARLELSNADDILDAGVEILAQPPGKRLQHLTLLSGGEKAVVAIALIFALFHVRPSPFCILDEVDAPLDEANGQRFNDLLREMSRVAQFIVITHNRTTMECADTLYGVTMPDPGVSKLVSVRVH